MNLRVTIPPAAEPLSLAEAKLHLRVDLSDDDTLISSLIQAAREHAEAVTRRALITRTYRLDLDRFPPGCTESRKDGDRLYLPYGPVQSVTSVVYLDTNGDSQTLDSSLYRLVDDPMKPYIEPVYGGTWPSVRDVGGAIQVTYTAGFGDAGSDLPESIRIAMKLMIAHWYENREAVVFTGAATPLPLAVDALLRTERLVEFD